MITIRQSEAIIKALESADFCKSEHIVYQHSSTPKSWAKWTGRKWGFVGGYHQYMQIKPWQMLDARLDGHKAYAVECILRVKEFQRGDVIRHYGC